MAWVTGGLAVASVALNIGGAIAGGKAKRRAIRERMRAQLAQQRGERRNLNAQMAEYSRRANTRLGQYLTEEYDLDADASSVLVASGVDLVGGSSLLIREKAKEIAIEKHANLVEDMVWKRRQAESQIAASREMDEAIKRGAELQTKAANIEQTVGVMKGIIDLGTSLSSFSSTSPKKPNTDAKGAGDFNINPQASRTV